MFHYIKKRGKLTNMIKISIKNIEICIATAYRLPKSGIISNFAAT